jgi:hypothetical protein
MVEDDPLTREFLLEYEEFSLLWPFLNSLTHPRGTRPLPTKLPADTWTFGQMSMCQKPTL